MALGTSRELPLVYSWSLPEVNAMSSIWEWLNLSLLGQGRTSQFLFPDHCPKWAQGPISDNDLTSALWAKAERLFLRLTFSSNETLFIPINRHVTWKFPFFSGVPVGYCLRNCLMIGWFKCLRYLQVTFRYSGFHLVVTSRHVISLVSCDCLVM